MKQEKSYYGGFFWLAALSFIVPVFVGIKAFDKVRPTSKPTPQPDASGVDHQLFDYILRTYVENGLVDYDGVARDYLFKVYLRQLSQADPSQLETDEEKLALHCNAYNAFVINGVIIHDIHKNEKNVLNYTPKRISQKIDELNTDIESEKRLPKPNEARVAELMKEIDNLRRQGGFFKLKEHIFAGETISLDHLEHGVIRPTFQDPRIHVALVCAARSCPAIRAEAYVGNRINDQLDDQVKQFANNHEYVYYEESTNSLHLSPILSWYGEDWDHLGGVLPWLSERVGDKLVAGKLATGDVKVKYNKYDWSLNTQASTSGAGGGKGGGFGSGSVPNE